MPTNPERHDEELAGELAGRIHTAFRSALSEFNDVTRRARSRFEKRDWRGIQDDGQERMNVYPRFVEEMVRDMEARTRDRVVDTKLWTRIKSRYAGQIAAERNIELFRTFYNSVARRIFSTVGVNPAIEFVSLDSALLELQPNPDVYRRYPVSAGVEETLQEILSDLPFAGRFRDRGEDARLATKTVTAHLRRTLGGTRVDFIEVLEPIFYRNKGAHVIGRVHSGDWILPLALVLLNQDSGIALDAVLMKEDDVSIVFSFARSYFYVETECPRDIIVFLKSIMPLKPIAELYSSLGYSRHGKTELYRSLRRHLKYTSDQFEIAEGDRGMVMLVFTLPSFDVVFKVIRDRFDYPKDSTHSNVMDRYRLVFKLDRVGRLVDAQEFEHLKFKRERFAEPLLTELLEEASDSVRLEGDALIIDHLYTERKVVPLNLHLRRAESNAALEAVIDYGNAIKDLAAANIFPGDFLLKNFGVTRHGRVVFYDYDELCLLDDCNFRSLPTPRNEEDELASEPWFRVADNDVFPEEFRKFLGIPLELLPTFEAHHGDLFCASFWKALQKRHAMGEILDFYPYPRDRRLRG